METQRLDTYSKILLATSTLNYTAWIVEGVQQQIKQTRMIDPIILEAYAHNEKILEDTLKTLSQAMEEIGNFINEFDMVTPMDERITSPAFDIIIHGKDIVELPYRGDNA